MWSKLSADLLGKEAQEALTGALQKGKEAWTAIEQSLDQAVDAEAVPSEEDILPISIPPLPPPRPRELSTSLSSSQRAAAAGGHEEQKDGGVAALSSSSSSLSPLPRATTSPELSMPKNPPSEETEGEGVAMEEAVVTVHDNDHQNASQTAAVATPVPTSDDLQQPPNTKKDKRKKRKGRGGGAASSTAAATEGKEEEEEAKEGRPSTPLSISSTQREEAAEEVKVDTSGSGSGNTSGSISPSGSSSGDSTGTDNSRHNHRNRRSRPRNRTHSGDSRGDGLPPKPTTSPTHALSTHADAAVAPATTVVAEGTQKEDVLSTPESEDSAASALASAMDALATEKGLRVRVEEERGHLEEQLLESQSRVALLEKEIKKAQAIYMGDEAKQRQIQALQEEGKALAFKQSEMEKLVRKSRGELKGVEAERDRLREEGEALGEKVETLTELIRKKDTENSGLLQSLAAVQAVNKAAAEKTSKLEQQLSRAQEEVTSQRAALEKAWGEEKEMKRMVSEMTTEQGTLQSQLDEDKALSRGLAGIKQDFEQREAVLHATNMQLQEALTRASFEAGLREDSLRQELGDMRKRWQDAVSRTEGLAADMHESTAPLLRQIKALQEEARGKAGVWASAEEALTERARTAESLARGAEAGRVQLGEKVEVLTAKVGELEVQLSTTTSKLHETAAQLKTMETRESDIRHRASELEHELKAAHEAVARAGKESKAHEHKLKLQLQEAKDALLVVKGDLEHEQAQLQLEVEMLKKELAAAVAAKERGGRDAAVAAGGGRRGSSSAQYFAAGQERVSQNSILEQTLSGSFSGHGGSSSPSVGGAESAAGGAEGEPLSVLALEKLQQALRQKEAEVQHLQSRLHDVERTRDALAEEVTVLGRQHSLQVAKALRAAAEVAQAKDLVQQKEVLLELLGEKTEELEVLQAEMETLKTHFRRQLDQILSTQQEQPQQSSGIVA